MTSIGGKTRPAAALLTWCVLIGTAHSTVVRAEVTLIGSVINIPAVATFAPAVAYNGSSDQYLVIWRDVADGWECKAVRVDAVTGAVLDSPFYISDNLATLSAITSAVTYNASNGEWLVVYQASQASVDGGKDDVFGQRFASNGTRVGGHLELVRQNQWQNSGAVACDATRSRYLVAWRHGEGTGSDKLIRARMFSATSTPVGLEITVSDQGAIYNWSPRVAYNPVADEFMIVWQDGRNWPGTGQDNDYSDIYGQRINAETGQKIGNNIPVYSPANSVPYVPDGQDSPGGIACNTSDGRYAVGITKLTAALGWTTMGFVIEADGTMVAPVFNLSYPSFGAQATPAYNGQDGTYFISYEGPTNNVAGKQISAVGNVMSGEETIVGTVGSIRSNALAVRSDQGEFLQVAVSDSGVCVGQRFSLGPDVVPPGAVASFIATPDRGKNVLSWTDPVDSDYVGAMVRYRTDTYPTGPADGFLVADEPGSPGAADGVEHEGLDGRLTYYYAAFAHDGTPNYAGGAQTSGWPYSLPDFEKDHDVDQADFGVMQACVSGSGSLPAPECDVADLDTDLDVDQDDFGILQSCMGGANSTPGC